jgi:hypothetical protein
VLLERDGERDVLETALRRAEHGAGSAALFSGEAGIGKTSLVRAFVRAAPGESSFLARRVGILDTASAGPRRGRRPENRDSPCPDRRLTVPEVTTRRARSDDSPWVGGGYRRVVAVRATKRNRSPR